MFFIFIILLLILQSFALYVRFVQVTETSGPPRPAAQPPGEYAMPGGHYSVRALTHPPEQVLAQLQKIVEATPIQLLSEGPPIVFATRSTVWAFPDMHHVWIEDGNLHVFAHLVYGQRDLGANRKRIQGWLDRLSL